MVVFILCESSNATLPLDVFFAHGRCCDEFVIVLCMCPCMWHGVWVYHDKTKTPDRNYLKVGTVVIDTMSQPTDFVVMIYLIRQRIFKLTGM